MADKSLHGNGVDCPACELRRNTLRADRAMEQSVDCNFCGGHGRVGKAVAEIIREACEWAAEHYRPERAAAFVRHTKEREKLHVERSFAGVGVVDG